MNPEYWLKRWSENRIGFHKPGVNPLLQQFISRIAAPPGRALAPLCGKSADLAWLAERGFEAVGVDLSEIAARAFVAEHKLDAAIEDGPPFRVYRAERLRFYVGDFFALTAARAGRFDFVYDRAALIALPPGLRAAYAAHLGSLMAAHGEMLLIALEYNPREMEGPPFSVPESEVRELFAGRRIERLYAHDCLDDEPHFRERGLTQMIEVVYLLTAVATSP
jgi:thiopurine S-methyltransferase